MPFKKGHATNLGRKLSKETRKKMSESHKGVKPSDWGAGFKKDNKPWNKNATTDAYFAGLIDADGYISIQNNSSKKADPDGRYKRVVVRVSMVDTQAIVEANKRYGGWIFDRKPRKSNKRGYSEWVLQHGQAEKFLRKIKPYLRIKPKQAEIALKYRWLQKRKRSAPKGILTNEISDGEIKYRQQLQEQLKELHLNKGVKNKISS